MVSVTSVSAVRSVASQLVCPAMQGHPCNAWYVAAFSREVGRAPFPRRILGQDVVFYRTDDGKAVALEGRCPHRGMPLSKGEVVGDTLRCGYHGFSFEATGACVHIPSQQSIPSKMKVRSYPLIEKWEWIWIWMGDPQRADPAQLPNHQDMGLERSDMTGQIGFMMEIQCNYQLLHENLLDTSHITYLHPGSFDTGNSATATFRVEADEKAIRLTREFPDDHSPLSEAARRYFDGPVNRLLITETFVPGLNVIKNIFYDAKRPERPPQALISPFGITPKDDRSCYHFIVSSMTNETFRQRTDEERKRLWDIFAQDRDALEAIQRGFEDLGPDAAEVSVRADEAGLRCRRAISELIRQEQLQDSSAAVR